MHVNLECRGECTNPPVLLAHAANESAREQAIQEDGYKIEEGIISCRGLTEHTVNHGARSFTCSAHILESAILPPDEPDTRTAAEKGSRFVSGIHGFRLIQPAPTEAV